MIRRIQEIRAVIIVYRVRPALYLRLKVCTARVGAKKEIAGFPDRSDAHPVLRQGDDGRDRYFNHWIGNGHEYIFEPAPAGCQDMEIEQADHR